MAESKYRILHELGAGGMGTVRKGLLLGEAGFQRPIVVKQLRTPDPEHLRLFVEEARRYAVLDHENIGRIFDFERIDGELCIVLEYIDGWSLVEYLERHRALGHLPDVDFVVFDKKAGRAAYGDLRRRMHGRRYDVLLHMQLAIRASLAAALVPADVKVGFARARARELQWLFTNAQVAPRAREHVLDGLFGFVEALGLRQRSMRWDIPLPEPALDYARRAIPDGQPTLVISPSSSHALRNWSAGRIKDLRQGHGVVRFL